MDLCGQGGVGKEVICNMLLDEQSPEMISKYTKRTVGVYLSGKGGDAAVCQRGNSV